MPNREDIEATKWTRRKFPEARIIMMTEIGPKQRVLDAMRASVAACVLKPVEEAKPGSRIERVVKRNPARRWEGDRRLPAPAPWPFGQHCPGRVP